jgi:hypothetical protein
MAKYLSSQWKSRSEAYFTLAMFTLSMAIISSADNILIPLLQENLWKKNVFRLDDQLLKPHSNKSMFTFQEFYPFYLTEHSNTTNRFLHFVGTSLCILGCLLFSPRTIACTGFVLPLALSAFFLNISQPMGWIEFATLLSTYLLLNKIVTGSFKGALAVILAGYAFAWFGHFFYQHNKPATFIYPTFSLMGDFKMWFDLASGNIKF